MTNPGLDSNTYGAGRVESLDVARGLTILVMLFVNDLSGVTGAPAWLKHIDPPNADGMTLADVVFPAFLFIVGLSLPLALERRLAQADLLLVLFHVLTRTVSLLIIGVFMVNSESIAPGTPLGRPGWILLTYAGVLLIWSAPRAPRPAGFWPRHGRRLAGASILVLAALLYRGGDASGIIQLRPHWWGILGLIGWAYFIACITYLIFRRSPIALLGVMALLYCVYFADRAGFFVTVGWLDRWVDIGSALGSHAAITLSGAIAGLILLPTSTTASTTHRARIAFGLLFGLGLAAAAVLLHALRDIHPMFIINKIAATPPWCLMSAAWTMWMWTGLYACTDTIGFTGRAGLLKAAGQNALFAFILGPILYALLELFTSLTGGFDLYAKLGAEFTLGFWRSLGFALFATWLTGLLWRRGWGMKL
jgi:heparan-alpha-glucosaminide N-acetyltransferase